MGLRCLAYGHSDLLQFDRRNRLYVRCSECGRTSTGIEIDAHRRRGFPARRPLWDRLWRRRPLPTGGAL